jgi:4-alpha-glucanotransferase
MSFNRDTLSLLLSSVIGRDRGAAALEEVSIKYKEELDVYIALQFLFDCQWKALKAYSNSKGLALLGDMPIYVAGHSADVWSNSRLFVLDDDKKPGLVLPTPFPCPLSLWFAPVRSASLRAIWTRLD